MSKFSVDWIYVQEKNYEYESKKDLGQNYIFKDKNDVVRLIITKAGKIIVLKDYAWDGCTPKFCICDIYVGIPDGAVHEKTKKPKTYYASLVHDALLQFMCKEFPFTRKEADMFFLDIMTTFDFAPKYFYYIAVRIFGGLTRVFANKIRRNQGTMAVAEDIEKYNS